MCSKFHGSSDKSCQDNLPETKIERKSPGCILGEPWTSVSPIQLVDVEIFPGKSMIRRPVSESKYCWCSRQSMLCVSTPPTSRGECAHPLFISFPRVLPRDHLQTILQPERASPRHTLHPESSLCLPASRLVSPALPVSSSSLGFIIFTNSLSQSVTVASSAAAQECLISAACVCSAGTSVTF